MTYEFIFTPRFQKHFKELSAQEKKRIKSKLELLAENPSHPSLRTKRIQGTTDLFECSVNMDIRIIWYYEGDKIIIQVYVGHHDILNSFNHRSGAARHEQRRLIFSKFGVTIFTSLMSSARQKII